MKIEMKVNSSLIKVIATGVFGLALGILYMYRFGHVETVRFKGVADLKGCELVAEAFVVKLSAIQKINSKYGLNGDEQLNLVSISDTNNCFFITKSPSTGEVRPWATSFSSNGKLKYVYEFQTRSNQLAVNKKERVVLDMSNTDNRGGI